MWIVHVQSLEFKDFSVVSHCCALHDGFDISFANIARLILLL